MKPQSRPRQQSARGRTRCSASCLAHKLKRPHQPAYRPQVLPGWYFCLAGSILHPLVERERVSGTSRVGVWFLRSAKTLFLCLHPKPTTARRKPCAIQKQSTTFIVLLPRTPSRNLRFLHRDSLLFASKKGCTLHIPSSCSALCLGVLVPWFSNPNQQRAPPKQDSHSEREAFSYHTYFISGKNNKLHILDAQQSSQGKRIQSIKLPTAPTPKRLFSFRSGHNKHKSRHKSRIGSLTTTQHK